MQILRKNTRIRDLVITKFTPSRKLGRVGGGSFFETAFGPGTKIFTILPLIVAKIVSLPPPPWTNSVSAPVRQGAFFACLWASI